MSEYRHIYHSSNLQINIYSGDELKTEELVHIYMHYGSERQASVLIEGIEEEGQGT